MKYCKNCGYALEDDANFCANCGEEQEKVILNYEEDNHSEPTGLAKAALWLSIFGIGLGLVFAIIGLCTIHNDLKARKKCKIAIILTIIWAVIGTIIGSILAQEIINEVMDELETSAILFLF